MIKLYQINDNENRETFKWVLCSDCAEDVRTQWDTSVSQIDTPPASTDLRSCTTPDCSYA